jgi:hypothetical protein
MREILAFDNRLLLQKRSSTGTYIAGARVERMRTLEIDALVPLMIEALERCAEAHDGGVSRATLAKLDIVVFNYYRGDTYGDTDT